VAKLRALAHQLPGDGPLVLETRLTPAAGRDRPVDLALKVTTPAQALALSAGTAPWQRCLRLWADRKVWRDRAPALWLEFDLPPGLPVPRPALALPPPILCAQLAPGVDVAWVAGTLLPAMGGAPLAAPQRRLLSRCWREIPAPARALYVFALRPRGTSAIRLELAGGALPALVSFLQRLQAAAAAAQIAGLAPLLAEGGRLHLSCDLGDHLQPRAGVEVSFPRQPRHDPRWERLLGRLVAAGLCAPAARDAALAWPGQDSLWTAPARWPLGHGAAAHRCARTLSHVKLVCDPGLSPEPPGPVGPAGPPEAPAPPGPPAPLAAKLYLLAAPLAQAPPPLTPPAGPAPPAPPDAPPGRGDGPPPAARSSHASPRAAASRSTRSR
jgi:hypothetical protein